MDHIQLVTHKSALASAVLLDVLLISLSFSSTVLLDVLLISLPFSSAVRPLDISLVPRPRVSQQRMYYITARSGDVIHPLL